MIDLKKNHLAVMMEAGYIYLGMRRFKEARAMFEGLTAIAPGSEVPLVALGNVDFCEGKVQKAAQRYRQALRLDPKSVFAKVYLGEALFFSGKKDEAIDLLASVAKADRGGAGEFAAALLSAIKSGFEPKAMKKGNGKENKS